MSEMRSTMADSVLAKGISYAQCWEDPAVLSAALRVGPDDDVLSIASAGDNSFALAIDGARSVTCIDLSLPQLALAELKLTAVRFLPVQSVRSLFGLGHFGRRIWFYHYLRERLSDDARRYWDAHEDTIRAGILGAGRFEKYLAMFRERILPVVHNQQAVADLLACTTLEEQRTFFAARWDSWRWRTLFRVFFSRAVMARTGRSPEHFAQVQGDVGGRFLDRARHALTEIPVQTNYFLRWMLTGNHGNLETAHPWLTTDGHGKLNAAAERIRFVHAPLEEFLGAGQKFSAFNYSNIFEYVPALHHAALLSRTADAAVPGARIAYWNLLVPRSCPPELAPRIERREAVAAALLAGDRAFVYGGFNVEIVR